MPPHKAILSLTNTCIEWVLDWLFTSLKLQGSLKERLQQREYVTTHLTSNIRQRLINITFQQHMYKWSLSHKCLMLEVLGDTSTQCIDYTESGYAYVDEVWQFYRSLNVIKIINLTRLGVVCRIKTESDKKYLPDINNTLYRAFDQMKNLRWVTLKGVADKTFLLSMGTNCPHLEKLNVAQSPRIDDEAVANLIIRNASPAEGQKSVQVGVQHIPTNLCANSLKMVCVSETNVTLASVGILLHFVPNLESFGGDIHAGSLCCVINNLHLKEGHKSFKLQELWDARILPQQASLLNVVCPQLTRLSTDASSLGSLENLSSITSLTLSLYYQNFENDIYDYLLENGEKLKELILVDHINCYLDLSWLTELAPNLEHLVATVSLEEGREVLKWPSLKTAQLSVESSRVLLALLTSITEVRDLDITFVREPYQETFECINDDLIICAVTEDGLKKLQKLKICECAIGLKGIDCLLLHCPDLCYLAPLAFWHGLINEDFHSLVQRIKENNWQLKLIMRADWEDGKELQEASKVP
ncbi:uncharacterized protein LOC125039419 isoform X2 [Penaeus chinensis]|uniref:uncharacterized protein LOC125039419 isoform X2 n=1 Tax=Penaeus chinensis TaxID=139456 RepID=UPI001FB5D5B9|nr:uncharacterized protein LOC125039419 isoform X2 [Penaeus chinensis]